MWDPPFTQPKTVASLAVRAVIIHADLLAARAGAPVTLEQLLQRLVLGNVAMTALFLAVSAAAFVEQQQRLAGLVMPDSMVVQAAQPGTVQLSLTLAVEAAGVPAQQTVLVVPRERDASLDVACQLLDLQTAVLVPAASQSAEPGQALHLRRLEDLLMLIAHSHSRQEPSGQASQLTSSGPQAAVSSPPALVVGHLMKPSRERDLASRGLLPLVPQHGISFVPIDTALLLEQQGPFDALLHKATDDLVSRGPGQLPAFSASVLALEAYCRAHPQTRIIEPLAMLEQVLDRRAMSALFDRVAAAACQAGLNLHSLPCLQLTSLPPPDELLGRLKAAGISLPAIFKSAAACGVAEAHKMAIALRPEGLSEVDVPMPACVQPFVDHGAVIHKIYAAGGQVFQSQKASVRDLRPWLRQGQDNGAAAPAVLNFDSLHSLPAAVEASIKGTQNVPDAVMQQVAGLLQAELGLLLFGFDLIIDAEGRLYIIDVNYFPSFKGINAAPAALAAAIRGRFCTAS